MTTSTFDHTRSDRVSDVLKIESKASLIDGCISAGAGAALMGTVLLKDTALDFLLPVADSILVLVLSLVIIGQPMNSMAIATR